MKLLIVTQAVDRNHSNLALVHRWIEEFAKHCEVVSVVCLFEGEHDLPANAHVYSLGKEKGRLPRARYALRFFKYIWRLKNEYDAVFVHMNPEYLLLGGLFWRMWGKKITLWYTHKSVTLKLRVAIRLTSIIFTASRESFRLQSSKVRVVGHGIDTKLFAPHIVNTGELRIVTVGRITKAKRIIEMLDAFDVLYARGVSFHVTIIGMPIFAQDREYEHKLRNEVAIRKYASSVHFAGAMPYTELPDALGHESVFLNLSETGSIDRAVLEAMSVGLAPVTSNEAFRNMLGPYGLYVEGASPERLADAMLLAKNVDRTKLSHIVEEHHSLEHLIPAILSSIEKI